jgi:hypothetical protein
MPDGLLGISADGSMLASLAKEKLIAHNLEDCAALELVTRAVAQACRQDIRPSSEAPQSLEIEIVVADNLESVLVAEIQAAGG